MVKFLTFFEKALELSLSNSYFYNTPVSQLENGFKVLQPSSQRTFDVTKNYLLPIPTKQISLNPDKLKQTPGW